MEAAHRRFARDATGAEAEAEGVVRLSVAQGFAQDLIAPALVRLRARHPKVRVELDASVRVLDLTRHEADLALRSVRPRAAELVMTNLGSVRWNALASPALADELGRLSSWDAAPWIAWDHDLTSLPAARWLARHARAAEIVLRTSHFASQLVAAASGLGVVLAPEPHGRAHGLAQVRFTRALEASAAECPSVDMWLDGHRALRDVPRVAAVWSFLQEALREGPGARGAAARR
jgi:DNA-binding transcriptional LysR family regulator